MTETSGPRLTKSVVLFVSLGLAALLFYLFFFVGIVNIVAIIEHVNLFYYLPAFGAFLASVFFSALTWHGLLSNLKLKNTVRRVFLLTWVGLFFDAVVPDPGWSGDFSKAYMLAKTSGQDGGTIAASVVGHKIIAMVVTMIDLILGLAILALDYSLTGAVLVLIVTVLILSVASLGTIVFFSSKPRATLRILGWLVRAISYLRRGRWDPSGFRAKAEELLKRFHEGIRILSEDRRTLARPVASCFLSWGLDVSVVFLTFASLGQLVPLEKILIVYALTAGLQAIGISFLGFAEIAMSSAYAVLGIPLDLSLSATLLTRVITLWFKLILGYVAFQWQGVKMLLTRKPSMPETSQIPVR